MIYDSHEYFTEVPELITRPRIRSFWLKLESTLFPKLKNVITVNPKLAEIYSLTYKVPVTIVKNVPSLNLKNDIKPLLSFPSDRKIILYQGALNMGRGLELMIDTMPYLKDCLFVLAGDGDISEELKLRVSENNYSDKVRFVGKLLPEELLRLTNQADIGISLEEDLGLNYRYCLPNKVFDYIQARIPVLVSKLPLLEDLLNQYKIGECLNKRNPETLAILIENIIVNKSAYIQDLEKAASDLNWNHEKETLIEFVKKIE